MNDHVYRAGAALRPLLFSMLLCGLWLGTAHAGDRVTVEPYGAYEHCLELADGVAALYSFSASDAIDFDIHYHADGKTRYPRRQQGVTEGKGSYRSRGARKYCLAWANPSEVKVELAVEVSTARR